MNNLAFIVGLGLAGIDPIGMMLLVTMQTAGLSKTKAYLYGGLEWQQLTETIIFMT